LPDYQRQNLWNYLKRPPGGSAEAASALMYLAWSSMAALAIAPLQDLLNMGPETRMNVPGRASGNWSWRVTEDKMSVAAFARLRQLTETSRRLDPAIPSEQIKLESAQAAPALSSRI
jgi:4-alpha-glucanotransferase